MKTITISARGASYTIDVESDDTGISGQCRDLPGCVARGDSDEEFESAMGEAIEAWLDGDASTTVEIPSNCVRLSRSQSDALAEGDGRIMEAAKGRALAILANLEDLRAKDARRLGLSGKVPRSVQVVDADGVVLCTVNTSDTPAPEPCVISDPWVGYGHSTTDRKAWEHLGLTCPRICAELRAAGYPPELYETVDMLHSPAPPPIGGTIGEALEDDAISADQALKIWRGDPW